MPPETIPIGELEDGSAGAIRGRVVGALRTIEGPDDVACVYYDRGEAGDGAESELFWLEDETGRVLIPPEFQVEGGNITHKDRVDVIDADVRQVSQRLSDIKQARRETRDGKIDKALLTEQRALKELATVLCCIRAQAHGKVHGGGRSLAAQAEFIKARGARLRSEGHVLRSVELALQVRQVVVAVGDEVVVEATFHDAPMPPGLGAGGGYRDRPTCLQARRLGADRPIRVSPTADSHAAEVMSQRKTEEQGQRAPVPAKRDRASRPSFATPAQIAGSVLLAGMVALYIWLTL